MLVLRNRMLVRSPCCNQAYQAVRIRFRSRSWALRSNLGLRSRKLVLRIRMLVLRNRKLVRSPCCNQAYQAVRIRFRSRSLALRSNLGLRNHKLVLRIRMQVLRNRKLVRSCCSPCRNQASRAVRIRFRSRSLALRSNLGLRSHKLVHTKAFRIRCRNTECRSHSP
jgi:hypothetical protein